MNNLKRSALATLVAMGLFVGSGIALAETSADEAVEQEETDAGLMADTLFSFGYDLINGLFLWNITSIDEPCVLPTVEDSDSAEEVADPECELTGGEVAGPNGQVNHGMFMKLFNSLFEGTGRGCVVRHLAQSDLGKGDQQVEGNDDGGEIEGEPSENENSIDFTTIETLCQGTDDADAEVGDDDLEAELVEEGNGKPPWAGKPEGAGKPDSPGKSGSAPGKNK